MSAKYGHRLFFTDLTLDAVRGAIAKAEVFFITPGYDIWKDFCDPFMDSFFAKNMKLYCAFLVERRESSESYYVDCNRAIRFARANVGTSGSETSSTLSFVTKWSTSGAALSRVAVPVTSASKKEGEKSGPSKKPKSSEKNQNKSSKEDKDPDVVHKMK